MTLTIEQRAARRTKKINNRVAKVLPLFAGTDAISQFLTDEAVQTQAINRWDEINERYFAHLEAVELTFVEKAKAYRSEVSELLPLKLIEFELELEYLISHYSAYQNNPAYIADFWYTKLKLAKS